VTKVVAKGKNSQERKISKIEKTRGKEKKISIPDREGSPVGGGAGKRSRCTGRGRNSVASEKKTRNKLLRIEGLQRQIKDNGKMKTLRLKGKNLTMEIPFDERAGKDFSSV